MVDFPTVDLVNVLQLSQEVTVMKMNETLKVKSHFKHTVKCLKKLGVPANNSIQVRISQGFNQIKSSQM